MGFTHGYVISPASGLDGLSVNSGIKSHPLFNAPDGIGPFPVTKQGTKRLRLKLENKVFVSANKNLIHFSFNLSTRHPHHHPFLHKKPNPQNNLTYHYW
jgi:hypothetical protein